MNSVPFMFVFFIIIAICSCTIQSEPYSNIQDEEAREIVRRSIMAHGGLENWESLASLSFDKLFTLYDSLGNEESNVHQKHHYFSENVLIKSYEGEDIIELSKTGNHYKQLKNGKLDWNAAIRSDIAAATFVMNLPYNFLNRNSRVSYDGDSTIVDRPVHIIRIEYPEKNELRSTKDTWFHYVDRTSHLLVGYKVIHDDHISFVRNVSFHTIDGFSVPKERVSFRVSARGKILYLRAKYAYKNYTLSN